MPADYPDYPNHEQVLAYLRDYARHFGIYEHITFNTSVETVARTEDGHWQVQLDNGETRIYGGLIIANGHHWDPKYPDFEGDFAGDIIHAKDYNTPEIFSGKRVLVVGAGNSGCDIVVDAAQNAHQTFHSMRRGYHFIPKYIFGKPTDQVAEVSVRLGVPMALRRVINGLLVLTVLGNPKQYGLPKPDHKLLQSHPIVNSQVLYYVGHGDITPKPNIARLDGKQVWFTDGSSEAIDLIVYATGYKLSFPFIDSRHLNAADGKPHLYMHAFHPEYDNLFVVGLLQPDSGIFWLMDYQAQLIARFLKAQRKESPKAHFFRGVKASEEPDLRGGPKIDTERHYLEIDHHRYRVHIKRLIKQMA
jgi:cation diffusion facilitator CzcD-associated flavoprotein CzcO